jgi:transposase
MAPVLPKEVVSSIECAIELALKSNRRPDRNAIAAIFNTTYASVSRIEKRVELRLITGIIPIHKPSGPRSRKTPEVVQAIKDLLLRRPTLDQSAISDYIREELGVSMSQGSVSRLLKEHDIPHKRTHAHHRKLRILPGKEWDKVTVRNRGGEFVRQAEGYVSPYAPIANADESIAYTPATTTQDENPAYAPRTNLIENSSYEPAMMNPYAASYS